MFNEESLEKHWAPTIYNLFSLMVLLGKCIPRNETPLRSFPQNA